MVSLFAFNSDYLNLTWKQGNKNKTSGELFLLSDFMWKSVNYSIDAPIIGIIIDGYA